MSARILVVDDILPNVKLLEAKLIAQYYDVVTASSGPEALEKIKETHPDIVLLDVMMPEMDGFEVCQKIKQDPEVAHTPVVMVTALTSPEDKVRGLEAGADDFLSKPINDTALLARVRSLVRLKMAMDEWRARESTANELGVADASGVMRETSTNAKVLLLEDREFEQQKVQTALEALKAELYISETGEKAIEIANNEDLDLIIISITLEKEDGLRLCAHFKTNQKTRSVPILMVGKEEQMDLIVNGLEIGAHDYILRPIDKNELIARVGSQVRRRRFQERLRSSYEVNLSMALVDSLTGLHNRRYLEVHMEKLMKDNQENGRSMGVLILDIDHFKAVNDTHGHNVGDEVLKEFGGRLKDSVRSFDLAARYGGEEFVVLLPDIHKEKAYAIAERLRSVTADKPFKCNVPEGALDITTSIGGTILESGDSSTPEQALEKADKALYEAKNSGRNCVVFDGVGKLNPDEHKGTRRPSAG